MLLSLIVAGASFAGPAVAQEPTVAERTLDVTEAENSTTVTVTVDVEFDQETEFQVTEDINSSLENVEIIQGTGSGLDNTNETTGEVVFNAIGDSATDTATLVYEVTVPDDAQAGDTYSFDGTVFTDTETPVTGDDSLTVVASEPTVDFSQQGVGLANNSNNPGVYATNVDSDGEEAALVVTYEDDAGNLTIAGLTTGTWDGDTVQVPLGTSDAALGGFPGQHTAHVIPLDGLSSDYEAGDTVSDATAANVSVNDAAPVYNWNVILSDQDFTENTSEITLDLGLVTDGMGDDTLYTVDLHPTDDQGNIIGDEFTGSTDVLSGQSDDVTIDLQDSDGNQITLEEGDEVEYIPMIHVVPDDSDAQEGDAAVPGTYPALTTSDNGQVGPAINESATISVTEGDGPPPVVGEDPPQDLDGDGLFEDVNGDGEFTVQDVQNFFDNRDSDAVQDNAQFFNFDEEEPAGVSVRDVQALFQLFQSQ